MLKTVLIFCLMLFTLTGLYSQEQQTPVYSISFQNTSLSKALRKLSRKTDFRFAFNTDEIGKTKVSGSFTDASISQITDQILPKEFTYNFLGDLIVIFRRPENSEPSSTASRYNFPVQGKVVDSYSREALPFAYMRIVGTNTYTEADRNGVFSLSSVPTDISSIEVSYIGYTTRVYYLSPDDNFESLVISMRPESVIQNGAEVVYYEATPYLSTKEASTQSINVLKIPQITNSGEADALNLVKYLPGFNASQESNKGLSSRGLKASENLILFDGYSLLNPSHFFGLFSAINSLSVKNIRVLKAAYSAEYGGRSSALIDITSYEGSSQKLGLTIKAGLLSSSFRFDGPLINEKTRFSFSGRKANNALFGTGVYSSLLNNIYNSNISQVGQVESSSIEDRGIESSVDFLDFQGKITTDISKRLTLSFSGFYNSDNSFQEIIDTLESSSFIINIGSDFNWLNRGGAISADYRFNKKNVLNTLVSFSEINARSNSLESRIDLLSQDPPIFQSSYENGVRDFTLKTSLKHSFSDSLNIIFGTEINAFNTYNNEFSFNFPVRNDLQEGNVISGFIQGNFTKNKLRIQPGLRISTYSLLDTAFIEPRIKVSYSLNPKISVKAAYGKHNQILRKTIPFNFFRAILDNWELSNENLPMSSLHHYVAGVNYTTEKLTADLEFFMSKQSGGTEDLSQITSLANSNRENLIWGDLYSRGIELSSHLNIKRNNFSLSYTLTDSEGEYIINSETVRIRNSRTSKHQLSGIWLWESNHWRLSSSLIYASGRPYTPVIGSYVIELPNQSYRPFLVFGDYNASNLPDYFRTDFSVGYRFSLENAVNVELSFFLQNVFDSSNLKFYSYTILGDQNSPNFSILEREISNLGRIPSVFLTLNF